jgi:hypothetical protein
MSPAYAETRLSITISAPCKTGYQPSNRVIRIPTMIQDTRQAVDQSPPSPEDMAGVWTAGERQAVVELGGYLVAVPVWSWVAAWWE